MLAAECLSELLTETCKFDRLAFAHGERPDEFLKTNECGADF
jgi:hypothetical protein